MINNKKEKLRSQKSTVTCVLHWLNVYISLAFCFTACSHFHKSTYLSTIFSGISEGSSTDTSTSAGGSLGVTFFSSPEIFGAAAC